MTERICEGVYGEACTKRAECYAMARGAGGWGGRYCLDHAHRLGFIITDLYPTEDIGN